MKYKRMLSLITAAALTGGAVTTAAIVAPSIVTAAETMADQYEPYFEDAVFSGESSGYSHLMSDQPLPFGTQFFLTDFSDFGHSNNIYFRPFTNLYSGYKLHVSDWGVPAEGGTTTARVTVIYPDGSAEIITAKLSIIPPHNESYDVPYGNIEVRAGESNTFTPLRSDLPTGTIVSIIKTADIRMLEAEGWSIQIVSDTSLSIAAPENASGSREINLIVSYPDGTTGTTNVTLDVQIPPMSETHMVSYEKVTVEAGKTVIAIPQNANVPEGTYFYPYPSQTSDEIINQGGHVSVASDGTVTVDIPLSASGEHTIPVEAWYPDGSYSIINMQLNVNAVDFVAHHDVTYPETTITAGATTTITPETTALPSGTTISMLHNTADATDWDINSNNNGVLTITAPITATTDIQVAFLVAYPDGTQEETTATIQVTPANQAGNHDVTYPSTTITAGDTTTITPETTALPSGTTITLVKDADLDAAILAGWDLTIADNGKITASTLESIVGGAVVNVQISYPDGTSTVTSVDLLALAKPVVEEPKDSEDEDPQDKAPTKPRPAPKSGGSSFGSS